MLSYISRLPKNKILCIDMKSFYASCECVDHGLDPLEDYVVVVSDKNRNGSVVLVASPKMKQDYGIRAGSRLYEVPRRRHIHIFNSRMKRYLEISVQITELFSTFVPFEAILTYSVDESWLTLDGTEKLYGSPKEAAQKIRSAIWDQFGLPSCVGIGPNRFISKVVLDVYAKKQGIAECTYEEVPKKLWPVPLREIWGIGNRMEQHLNNMGMYTLGDVANSSLDRLRKRFGVIGEQIYYHAWGIDLSPPFIDARTFPQKSIGKGITLLRDYWRENEILTVVLELCEEVAKRAREIGKVGRTVSFSVRYSLNEGGFHQSVTLDTATNLTMDIYRVCKQIFHKFYDGRSVRVIHVSLGNLMDEESLQLSLFEDRTKERALAKAMDAIRDKFGPNALLRAVSYTPGSVARIRLYRRASGMNHRDRGIIKYSPFLMPEHRKMLKELREKEERIHPSHHDEQQYEEWNRIIFEAMEFASYLSIQYIHNYRLCCVIGRVHYYDQLNQTLRFKEKNNGKIHYIHVPSIKDIKIAPSSP